LWEATLTNKIHGSQLLLTQQMVFYHAAILTAVNQEVNGKKVARALGDLVRQCTNQFLIDPAGFAALGFHSDEPLCIDNKQYLVYKRPTADIR